MSEVALCSLVRDGMGYLPSYRRQLESLGVAPTRIEDVDECTACRPADYHSFRRDGAASGRMISYVGWREGIDLS